MTLGDKQITGIVSKNSIDYVKAIFHCYSHSETVILLRDESDNRIELMGVSKVINPSIKTGWFNEHVEFRDDNVLAQIAFTSGTEGEPKGVLLTHKALTDVTKRLNNIMAVDSSIMEYVGIPANFSFGLGRFRAISAVGGKAFLPKNGFDPVEIQRMLEKQEINAISAVPSLWRVLLRNKDLFGDEVIFLKWIEIGSQYMSRSEKEELKSFFPNAKIAQHYGLTEASRTTFLRIDEVDGELLESVGRAYGDTELKIDEKGRICIRGSHVAKTLFKHGEYTSNLDSEQWFHTSDLGKLENGFLYYLGRADDQINCNGIKLNPDNIEREIREELKIKDGIAVGAISNDFTGESVLLAVKADANIDTDKLIATTYKILSSKGINGGSAAKFCLVNDFPLTNTNKVRRKALAELYTDKTAISIKQASYHEPRNDFELSISVVWQGILKRDAIGIDDNFFALGGDSLTAVMAVHEMVQATDVEFELGDLFTNQTIRTLSEHVSKGEPRTLSSVVPLKKGKSATPIFFVCGINLYQHLADALPSQNSVYGIYVAQEEALFKKIIDGQESDISTTELSKAYADAILRYQPEGPYVVAGISFGGMIALETAVTLQKRGKIVDTVVMLDTILPQAVKRTLPKRSKLFFKSAYTALKNAVVGKSITTSDVDLMRKRAYHRALENYNKISGELNAKVLLIKAEDRSEWGGGVSFESDYGWQYVLGKKPEVYEVDGSHIEIITPPQNKVVADIIVKAITKS